MNSPDEAANEPVESPTEEEPSPEGDFFTPTVFYYRKGVSLRDADIAIDRYQTKEAEIHDLAEVYHEASKIKPHLMPTIAASVNVFFTPPMNRLAAVNFPGDPSRERIFLPTDFPPIEVSVTEAIRRRRSCRNYVDEPITLEEFSSLLWHSCGLNASRPHVEGFSLYFRAHASGGGLYPVDLYVLALNVEGVPKGVYFYNTQEHSLELVRKDDNLEDAAESLWIWGPKDKPTISKGYAALFCLTGSFWRTRAKYGLRGYRLALQESGTMTQNFYINAAALNLGCTANASFWDAEVDDFLGLDGTDESILVSLVVGRPDPRMLNNSIPMAPGALREGV